MTMTDLKTLVACLALSQKQIARCRANAVAWGRTEAGRQWANLCRRWIETGAYLLAEIEATGHSPESVTVSESLLDGARAFLRKRGRELVERHLIRTELSDRRERVLARAN